jgi:hypothetical protein
MNETEIILASMDDAEQDATANRAIRGVASTPSPQHIIPAEIVAFLYEHVDQMRAELFAGLVPEVVLSFDVTDRRTLGHYHLLCRVRHKPHYADCLVMPRGRRFALCTSGLSLQDAA